MSPFGKFTVSAALLLPLALGGCKPTKGTANPEDYFPLIQVAMGGGETAAMIGRNEAIKAKNFAGCVASESLITAFDSANQVLAGRLGDKVVIPAVEIDVSECLALRESPAEEAPAEEAGDENASVVTHSVMVAAYVAPAEEEAPAEEAPAEETATEEAPAEEAEPAEEAPAEEAPAEEPEEEEPEEVASDLKGNPEAAALVETIAGITMVAVLSYAAKLQTANCKKGTVALGAINYVNGMIKPIADEIADPDGKVSVPAVAIDLSECAED